MQKRTKTTKTVNHVTSKFILARMMLTVFVIALKKYRNPITTITVLKQINRRKKIVQGITDMPKLFKNGKRYFYELNQPGWPSPAFKRFFENELNKTIPIDQNEQRAQNVVFAITRKCGLNCKHCFEWDRLDMNEILNRADLLKILDEVQKLGASIIQVSGGEPMERFEDACTLAEKAHAGTDFWLLTSGFGLTIEKAIILKESGYTGINISLDHWDEKTHNKFRGNKNSFEWVAKAAGNAVEAGLIVALSVCASREFTTKENLYKYLEVASSLQASFIQILEPRPVGRFAGKDVSLSTTQRKIISEFYHKVNNDKDFNQSPTIIYHGAYQRSHGCLGAANRYFYIDSEGNAHACPFCQDTVGNVLENSMELLLDRIENNGCHLFRTYAD